MNLDDVLSRLAGLDPKARAAVAEDVMRATKDARWLPNPGPQTSAYFSPADILLYGGQGGGGKSDLGLGLAFTEHQRSLILRRKYANLSGITERAIEINSSRDGYNGSPPPLLRTKDGRYIQFAGNQHLGDEQDWQGIPFDLKVFDEATQFLEAQIRFHLGWMRSTVEGQRVRAVLATNPPLDADGDWIIGMFRPWLDVTHPAPAEHGELRWFVTDPDGKDQEVDGPRPVAFQGLREPAIPMSRTFIPAALKDNPFLINTGYQAKLDGLPEPYRSAVRDGNFMAARQDSDFQVIPTQWIIEAQSRWQHNGWQRKPMSCMALDPAGGGADSAELALRHGEWVGELVSEQGPETADGAAAAATVVKYRRNACPVVVDTGGGYGGAVTMRLAENGVMLTKFNGANASLGKTRDGSLGFVNARAEALWRVREELDPDQDGGATLALPPDPELRSDLAAPTFKVTSRGILIESKDELRKRLGRSTGKGDAVAMLIGPGNHAAQKHLSLSGAAPRVLQSRQAARSFRR